jgi:hypothetical protein
MIEWPALVLAHTCVFIADGRLLQTEENAVDVRPARGSFAATRVSVSGSAAAAQRSVPKSNRGVSARPEILLFLGMGCRCLLLVFFLLIFL